MSLLIVEHVVENDVDLKVHADAETRSRLDLRKVGAYRYFEDPSTRVLMLAYRIGGLPLDIWEHGQPQPDGLKQAIADGALIVAHNAEFEMLCFDWLCRNEGWLVPQSERKFHCTAAMAAALALPRDLETLGAVLGLKTQKDKEGKRLIDFFSKPRRDGGWNEREEFPAQWFAFKSYCLTDVETEEQAERRMLPLSKAEQDVYRLGLTINQRGLRIDRRSAEAALTLAEKATLEFDAAMAAATNGAVRKCSEAAKLHRWLNDQGITTSSAAKADLLELLRLDLPSHVKQAIRLRLAAGKTSVSKLKAMLSRASLHDDRVRGGFVYHAASTGRFQSFGVNFANLPRPREIFKKAKLRPSTLFRAIRHGEPRLLELLYGSDLGSPMHLLSDAVRGFIWAAPGKKLVVSDFSGIEGVVIAWLAGEEWKLAAFADILADPLLPDMYRRTAAQIMGMDVTEIGKDHPLRQSVGKISELALGFGGGVGAFASMARGYNIDLDRLYDPVYNRADDFDIIAAEKRYKECCTRKERTTLALSPQAWVACELVKRGWRAANPAIKTLWWDLEEGVREAVHRHGTVVTVGRLQFLAQHGYLFCRLPSGRCLAYASPRLKAQVYASRLIDDAWAAPEVMEAEAAEKLEAVGKARIERKSFPKATALGVDSTTKQFRRFGLYGGLLAENATQAVARDLLVNGMQVAERHGYVVIGTIYDEIISEVPCDFGSAETLSQLICQLPKWAKGLPLGADGYAAKRYRKG